MASWMVGALPTHAATAIAAAAATQPTTTGACCRLSQQLCCVPWQELGRQYGAPLEEEGHRFRTDYGLSQVRSAARALLSPKSQDIPAPRRLQLQQLLAQHFALPEPQALTQNHLQQAAEVEPRRPKEEWASHASTVITAVMATGSATETGTDRVSCCAAHQAGAAAALEQFVRGWRQHFLDVMAPRHLPAYWSVHARVRNSSGPSEIG
jgi:hypothetical protein